MSTSLCPGEYAASVAAHDGFFTCDICNVEFPAALEILALENTVSVCADCKPKIPASVMRCDKANKLVTCCAWHGVGESDRDWVYDTFDARITHGICADHAKQQFGEDVTPEKFQ